MCLFRLSVLKHLKAIAELRCAIKKRLLHRNAVAMRFVRARLPNKGGTVALGFAIRAKRLGERPKRQWLSPHSGCLSAPQ